MQEDYQLWVWLDFVSLLGSTFELYIYIYIYIYTSILHSNEINE